MDTEFKKQIEDAISFIKVNASIKDFDYQHMDPVAKMMLLALIHETQQIHDELDGVKQKIEDRFCDDFIPHAKVNAMPAIALVAPEFKDVRNKKESYVIGPKVPFTLKPKDKASKTPVSYLPLLRTMLIPHDDIFVVTQHRLHSREYDIEVDMGTSNTVWIGIKTQFDDMDTAYGMSIYLRGIKNVMPKRISVLSDDSTDISFGSILSIEDMEMLEPFDSQQSSGRFLSMVNHWQQAIIDNAGGILLFVTDKLQDRDTFKPRAYPKVFETRMESEVLDCFNEKEILWLQLDFPDNYVVPDECQVVLNTLPIVNVNVESVTLTETQPIAKLQKQEDAYFLQVLETSNAMRQLGFGMTGDEFVVRDFDASCYHDGDLYREVRNLFNHFKEDYYAFIDYNELKDRGNIEYLRKLVNEIGKMNVRNQVELNGIMTNKRNQYDSGTYAMKNIACDKPTSNVKVSFITTLGERGNLLYETLVGEKSELTCHLPLIEQKVPVVVGAVGGRNKATPDERYQLIRYYALTDDRLYTKMDVDAYVRKHLNGIYGKKEMSRIYVNLRIEGAAGRVALNRGLYVDIDFKDKRNYNIAINQNLEVQLRQKIINKSCISMPIIVTLNCLENICI